MTDTLVLTALIYTALLGGRYALLRWMSRWMSR